MVSSLQSAQQVAQIRHRAGRRQLVNIGRMLLSLFCLVGFETILSLLLEGRYLLSASDTIRVSALLITGIYLIIFLVALRLSRWTRFRTGEQLLSVWLILGLAGTLGLLMFRLPYSVTFLGLIYPTATVILLLFGKGLSQRSSMRLGVPALLIDQIDSRTGAFIPMDSASLPEGAIDAVLVSEEQLSDSGWTPFLSWCALNAVPVIMIRDYIEAESGRVDLKNFTFTDLLHVRSSDTYLFVKRVFDAVCSLLLLLVFSIPMALMVVVIKLETTGPAIFAQQRIGLGGVSFTMYKFRSMVTDAERGGAQFAAKGDKRVTRVGKFIRKFRIDELPQLYNVLRGDMSLIGPRPEQKNLLDELVEEIPLFPFRHSVRPGITGWAQVCQGYAYDVDSSSEKITYDLFYIKNLSFLLDMTIIVRTIRIMLTGFGSR
ncbi:MAG: exopolysaccharide biosynthesis polyprenyl glycosylphosphotransferase [SAR116 cluster bacterium]|nr:MAG: exopolysaccharide biosynthesis polyprenyl glycosylphosphotransferase [SAR116 cluster bacterium]